ncbi:MAG: PQQ-dependent sugar dehydrogenase [Geovibrio sp.]|nr:PQQ-dependent sugar dehydrogenase [Geovibrio sp.]
MLNEEPSFADIVFSVDFPAADAQTFQSEAYALRVSTVASGLEHPWGMAFLPDGRMLVTERPGRMRLVTPDGAVSKPLTGLPAVFAEGQGGLLDVAVEPQFNANSLIYFSFSEQQNGLASTAVARAELSGSSLKNVQVIFRQNPKVPGRNHWGSRLVFAQDGTLFITLGDRFDYRDQAQNPENHMGKVVRINTDGSPASGSPFVRKAGALPEIWSYGHRNVQGAAIEPSGGKLWTVEHGPRGGDELNLTEAGFNYGWPEASYGSHYSGMPIPDSHAEKGFREPVYQWTPSLAPSGLMFYTGGGFPEWRGERVLGHTGRKKPCEADSV